MRASSSGTLVAETTYRRLELELGQVHAHVELLRRALRHGLLQPRSHLLEPAPAESRHSLSNSNNEQQRTSHTTVPTARTPSPFESPFDSDPAGWPRHRQPADGRRCDFRSHDFCHLAHPTQQQHRACISLASLSLSLPRTTHTHTQAHTHPSAFSSNSSSNWISATEKSRSMSP